MSTRSGFYFLLFVGMFLTGAGHFIVGPAIIVLSVIYRERIVATEEGKGK